MIFSRYEKEQENQINKEKEEAWDIFSNNNKEKIDNNTYVSLMEMVLSDVEPTLYKQYRKIKNFMLKIWQNEDIKIKEIDKKDHSHANRICNYIENLLFDKNTLANGECHSLIDIEVENLFALLCAIQLHDYGKARWQLIYLSLIHELVKTFPNDKRNLTCDQLQKLNKAKGEVDELETAITEVIERNSNHGNTKVKFSDELIANAKDLVAISKELSGITTADDFSQKPNAMDIIENYHAKNIKLLLETFLDKDKEKLKFIYNGSNGIIPDIDAETSLRHVLEELSLKHLNCLKKIQTIASSHSPFVAYFENIKDDGDFDKSGDNKWLCALLRFGDSLDIDRSRIISMGKRDLTALLDRYLGGEVPKNEINGHLIKTFAIWIKFLLVKQVDIIHCKNGKTHNIEIQLNYRRFPSQEKHFYTLRYCTEKDFFNLKFLDVLHDKIKETNVLLKMSLTYKIVDEIDPDYPSLNIENKVAEVYNQIKEEKNKFDPGKTLQFYRFEGVKDDLILKFIPFKGEEAPNGLYLPRSLDHYSILRSIKDNCNTIDEVKKYMGSRYSKKQLKSAEFIRQKKSRFIISSKGIRHIDKFFRVEESNSIIIKGKICELQNFGMVFPFSCLDRQSGVSTGIEGLDEILLDSPPGDIVNQNKRGSIKHSRNIIIKGGPGTGKSTLALQVLNYNLSEQGRKVLYLTFEEKESRLKYEYENNFGWKIDDIHSFPSFQHILKKSSKKTDPDKIACDFFNTIKAFYPDILVIDSLNRLKDLFLESDFGEVRFERLVRSIFTYIQLRSITAFYILEEGEGTFEEYACDGIIYLANNKRVRSLEVKKLRNQNVIPGEHRFYIIDSNKLQNFSQPLENYWLKPGINVFPNIREYKEYVGSEFKDLKKDKYSHEDVVETGIKGLDKLLPLGKNKGGFIPQNVILIIGSPGSGKTIAGIHFIKAGTDEKECGLWITFEGSKQDLFKTISRFNERLGFRNLIKDEKKFLFHYFPPAYFNPDELIFSIRKIVSANPDVKRLVIDSISEIEELFPTTNQFKNYMTVFLQELRKLGLTTVFLYRLSEFFGFPGETKTSISSIVDTIISIKTFDIKNKIKKGLFILKSRGREQISDLQTMEILPNEGIVTSKKGWELEGLLSGETGEIKEPYIFLKLFYENYAEAKINNYLINDFRQRYPAENRIFTCVRKPQIHSEFWSFKGNFGAGHANIRVVSLNEYMVEAFRETDRLHILDVYFSTALNEETKSNPRWNRYSNKDDRFDFMPCYIDFGMLVYQKHLEKNIDSKKLKKIKKEVCKDVSCDRMSWDEMLAYAQAICNELNKNTAKTNGFQYFPFGIPPLSNVSEFIAFFMELLWSHGGDIFTLWPYSETVRKETQGKESPEVKKSAKEIKRENKFSYYKDLILYNKNVRDEAKDIISKKVLDEELKESLLKKVEEFRSNWKYEEDTDMIIRINDENAQKALTFLYNLVYEKGCKNPALGDFSSRSVFSRKWYGEVVELRRHILAIKEKCESQYIYSRDGIHAKEEDKSKDKMVNKKIQEIMELPIEDLPESEIHKLPYVQDTKKSYTVQGIWCLAIIKEALSPEIGWIFIDSMAAPDIVKMRSMERLGFPVKIEDIQSETYNMFDPVVYKKIEEIMKLDSKLEDSTQNVAQMRKSNTSVEDFKTLVDKVNTGPYSDFEINGLREMLEKSPNDEKIQEKLSYLNEKIPPVPTENQEVQYCSKLKASRPYFYRLEPILHKHIKKLFSPEKKVNGTEKKKLIKETLNDIREDLILEIFKNPII